MQSGLRLINWTRREYLIVPDTTTPLHDSLPQSFDRNALVTTYLCNHPGEWIASMEETQSRWPFPDGDIQDLYYYTDVTAHVIAALLGTEERADNPLIYREDEYPTAVYIQRQRPIKPYPPIPAWPRRPDGAFLADRDTTITYCLYKAFRMGIRLETTDYGATWHLTFDQPWRPRPLFSQVQYDPHDGPPPSFWSDQAALRARYPASRQSMHLIELERPGQHWWTVDLPVATVQPIIESLNTLVLPLFASNAVLSDAVHELTLRQGATHHRLMWVGFDLPAGWEGVAPLLQTLTDLVHDQLPHIGLDHDQM